MQCGDAAALHTKNYSSNVDLSDDCLQKAWEQVLDEGNETVDFCIFRPDPQNKKKIILHQTGRGGFAVMQSMLTNEHVQFCGFRFLLGSRPKFLFVSLIGEYVPAMAKGRAGLFKQGINNFFSGVIGSVELTSIDECTVENIVEKIKGMTHTEEVIHL